MSATPAYAPCGPRPAPPLAKREWFAGNGRWQYRPIHRSLATP